MFEIYTPARGRPKTQQQVSYTQALQQARTMSDAELCALIAEQQDSDEQWAFEELWRRYHRLIHYFARRMERRAKAVGVEYDDLVGVGQVALLQAIHTYDPAKAKLVTHIGVTIHGKMRYIVREASGERRAPERRFKFYSLSAPIADRGGVARTTLGDLLPSAGSGSGEEFARVEAAAVMEQVMQQPAHTRNRWALMRYLRGFTQQEIANTLGCSQVTVSRMCLSFAGDVKRALYA